jgi:hypothetical protein
MRLCAIANHRAFDGISDLDVRARSIDNGILDR